MAVDQFAFGRRARHLGILYVAVTAPLCGVAFWGVEGEHDYLSAMLLVGVVYALPGSVLAVVASVRAAPGDRTVWRIWALAFAAGSVSTLVAYVRARHGWEGYRSLSPARTAVSVAVLAIANTLMLRRRSGMRAVVVDVVELLMATIAITAPVALAVGDRIVESPHAWFTVSAGLWWVAAVHGLLIALVLRARVREGERQLAHAGIALAVTALVTTAAGAAHGLGGFSAPSGPFLALHALFIGMMMVFFLHSRRSSSVGLERLPAAAQVRRHSAVVIGVLVAVPVIAVQAWAGRDEDWVLLTALAAVAALMALSTIRHLLSARETRRLYAEVERAAAERGDLLAEVMAHVDADRHRVAAHLHREAVSLYTAMAGFTCALERSRDHDSPEVLRTAAERMRADLARRADGLRRVALAVKPISPLDRAGHGLAAPIRAYLENLYSDDPRPRITVDVDQQLSLDWTTEAIVVRILQEATNNVWRHAGASEVRVAVRVEADRLVVEVADDGCGAGDAPDGRGIATMRGMSRFLGGDLSITSGEGGGTVVRAEFGFDALPQPARPVLHVVRS